MAKGGAFEREIMKRLSLWWTYGERDDVFTRTMGSGGYATLRKRYGKETAFQTGDITFADPIGAPLIEYFCLETKTGYATRTQSKGKKIIKNWCVLDPLDSMQKKPVIVQMWEQVSHDSEESDRTPLLIFRRFAMKACVALAHETFERVQREYGPEPRAPYIMLALTDKMMDTLYIIGIDNFFDWCPDIRPVIGAEPWQSKKSQLSTSTPTKKPSLFLAPD